MSELVSIEGIAVLGPLPKPVQETTVLAAALPATVRNAAAARALIVYIGSEDAHSFLVEAGLDPAGSVKG